MKQITSPEFVEVAVMIPVNNLFVYKIPEHLIPYCQIGKRVLVPFRKSKITGYIFNLLNETSITGLRNIYDILDDEPLLLESMIPFYKWISNYYFYPLGLVIKACLPDGFSVYEINLLKITDKGISAYETNKLNPIEKKVLMKLKQKNISLKSLRNDFDNKLPYSSIKNLEKKNFIEIETKLSRSAKPKFEKFVKFEKELDKEEKISAAKKKIIEVLCKNKTLPVKALNQIVSSASKHINFLENLGIVSTYSKQILRDPFGEEIIEDEDSIILNKEQNDALSEILKSIGNEFKTYLLYGITGSGKTQVYLHACSEALKNGCTAIVLVPEIALISQLGRLFRIKFKDRLAVLHSGLSKGQRYDQWIRILKGDAKVVIGARSAIFAPVKKPGIIIVDEEHDTSYKQSNNLKYNGRDLAILRAKLENCPAVLGSATPSVQSFYNSLQNKYKQLRLTKRVEDRKLPEINVVDLKQYKDIRGIRRFISPPLEKAISETVMSGKQVLIFLNRRGFATLPICAYCGEPVKCKNCDITLTYHKKIGVYKCHYCGYNKAFESECEHCGKNKIMLLGLGTEKLEELLKAIFPYARVARMDQDTTSKKGSIIKILKDVKDNMIDILIGTQMIAKGHDFPNITLVGIICADLTLSFPDFRSGELTFQLLSQVSGRAGRGDTHGKVIMQTYNPDHFIIINAKEQNYSQFYNQEISFREMLRYPPFSRLVKIQISDKKENIAQQESKNIGQYCRNLLGMHKIFKTSIEILGPVKAPVAMIKNQYRWQLLIKGFNDQSLHYYIKYLFFNEDSPVVKTKVKIIVDVDPMDMM